MSLGNQHIGKRFVIPKKHIETRPQFFDEVGFQQKGLGLCVGHRKFHRACQADHGCDAVIMARAPCVMLDPIKKVARLAHI